MSSGLITTYLGQGLSADRPTTPDIPAGAIAIYFATDGTSGAEMQVYANGSWHNAVSLAGALVGSNNLSDVANPASARSNLGLAIGTNVQAYSAKLAAIAANTVSSQTGTSYTAVLADADTYIRFSNASAISFTIPPNSSVAFPVGTVIEVEQAGAGALSFVAGSGVTINSRSSDLTLAGQYAVAFAKKVATDTWVVNGDL